MTTLHLVTPDRVEEVYPLIKDRFDAAVSTSNGRVLPEDVLALLIEGRLQLWVVLDGDKPLAVVIGEITIFPRLKDYRLICCVGEHREKWLHHLETIEDWARSMGCTLGTAVARKGWVRLLKDYKLSHVLLERAL